jgi:hypothetical protein
VVLRVYITDSFFIRYQGVGFGLLALGVACVPGMAWFQSVRRAPEAEQDVVDDQTEPVASHRQPRPVGAR